MSSIFDPGRADRERASSLAQQGIINGQSFSGPGGIGGSFNFQNGQGTMTSSLGSFQSIFDSLQRNAGGALNQAQQGLPPELQQLADRTMGTLGSQNIFSEGNDLAMQGFRDVFSNAQQTATADPFDLGSTISEKLRQLSERRNSRLVNKTFDRLKASGKLGTSGGAGIAGELEQNLFDQGLQFDLAGLQQGQSMQRDAFGRMQGSAGGMESILSRMFGESMGMANFNNNAAMQQFGVGNQMFQNFLQNQLQGTNIGIANTQAAAGLSQLPLAFQQALMGMTGQSSNSNFAAAGVEQTNASMAASPFLEALTAAGGLASAVGGTGGLLNRGE